MNSFGNPRARIACLFLLNCRLYCGMSVVGLVLHDLFQLHFIDATKLKFDVSSGLMITSNKLRLYKNLGSPLIAARRLTICVTRRLPEAPFQHIRLNSYEKKLNMELLSSIEITIASRSCEKVFVLWNASMLYIVNVNLNEIFPINFKSY